MMFRVCGFRAVPSMSSDGPLLGCRLLQLRGGLRRLAPALQQMPGQLAAGVLGEVADDLAHAAGLGEDIHGDGLRRRGSPRRRIGAGAAVHQQLAFGGGSKGLVQLRLPEGRQPSDVGQRGRHRQPVGRHPVREADGAPERGNDQHGLVGLLPLRRRQGAVAESVVQHAGIHLVGRGGRFGVQPGVAFDVGLQRRADAEQRQGILVRADRTEGLQDLGPVRVEPGKAQGRPVDGVAAGSGGLALGGRQQNQHRSILPAPGQARCLARKATTSGRTSRQ